MLELIAHIGTSFLTPIGVAAAPMGTEAHEYPSVACKAMGGKLASLMIDKEEPK
jgi:hypothetical protein